MAKEKDVQPDPGHQGARARFEADAALAARKEAAPPTPEVPAETPEQEPEAAPVEVEEKTPEQERVEALIEENAALMERLGVGSGVTDVTAEGFADEPLKRIARLEDINAQLRRAGAGAR